jgi:type III secretory pathway component EscR
VCLTYHFSFFILVRTYHVFDSEKCYAPQIFFLKVGSQVMSWDDETLLGNQLFLKKKKKKNSKNFFKKKKKKKPCPIKVKKSTWYNVVGC